MSTISSDLNAIVNQLPSNCTLVAVSKTKPNSDIMEAYHAGHRHFGENKVQELSQKANELPKDIKWHMIGHLQRNKVKYIAPFVHLIHGVDSLRLLKEINKQAHKAERVLDCLLQVFIADEETKFGFDESEVKALLEDVEFNTLSNVRIVGLMGMATNTKNQDKIGSEFRSLKLLFDELKERDHPLLSVSELSMGMSNDYLLAIKEGSNMVRIGSAIFGERNYS